MNSDYTTTQRAAPPGTLNATDTRPTPILLATDLDGTLLDRSYHMENAALAVNALLRERPDICAVVLATSKTLSELQTLAGLITHQPILVYENGAGYAVPSNSGGTPEYDSFVENWAYEAIRARLVQLRQDHQLPFVGFGDMSPAELSRLTGLSVEDAVLAQRREASEPLLWRGTAEALAAFEESLAAIGLSLVRGGQFYHVSAPTNKALAVARIKERLHPNTQLLACGDAPNDLSLLTLAEYAAVFPCPDGTYLLPSSATVVQAEAAGPGPWHAAISQLFTQSIRPDTALGQTL